MKNKQDNLNTIKDVTSLEELSKYDRIIRQYMKGVVKSNEVAEDLVNDMYIKMHKVFENGKTINGGYVFLTLKNIHLNHLKQYTNRFDYGGELYEATIPETEDDYLDTLEDKEEDEELYEEMESRIENLTWYEKKILELEGKMTLKELSKQSQISYRSLIHSRDKLRAKIGYKK